MERRYNYVFFEINGLYSYSYSDLQNEEGVVLLPHKKHILGKFYPLYRFHFSNEVNRRVVLPYKNLWNKFYFNSMFGNTKPICFVFSGRWVQLAIETKLLDYYREKYPGSKMVWFCQDTIENQKQLYLGGKLHNVYDIFSHYDLLLSIDNGDCAKYGMIYHPLVFSSFHGELKSMPQSDMYFLGKAKNRLSDIIKTYETLREKGMVLDFNIVGVNTSDRVYSNEIHYIDYMTYSENLQHIMHTKCLLEIMQHGQTGYTQRAAEAVCLDKLLLTNNQNIKETPFFNPSFISIFNNISSIDNTFLDMIKKPLSVNYNYKEKMSPIELVNFIDERL